MAAKPLPRTNCPIVLLTDFDHPEAWQIIRRQVSAPVPAPDGATLFYAYVEFLDDPSFRNLTTADLLARSRPDYKHFFLFAVDKVAVTHPELPILVIDLNRNPGSTFRAIPRMIQSIENNLSISNMDFFEFARAAHPDGIFRGFGRP